MSKFLLPSMTRLITQPWKNHFLIKSLEKHNEKLIRDIPELLFVLANDPKAFDQISLKMRANEKMLAGTSAIIWGFGLAVAPWVAEQVVGYWCEHQMAANPDIASCTVESIDHLGHINRVLFFSFTFGGFYYWDWFRIQYLRQDLLADERAASRVDMGAENR